MSLRGYQLRILIVDDDRRQLRQRITSEQSVDASSNLDDGKARRTEWFGAQGPVSCVYSIGN